MRKKDKAIKEAFQVYQTNKESTLDDYEIATGEGFEDKIYNRIAGMNIPNPRAKAHRIWLGIMGVMIVAICAVFFIYRKAHTPVDVTKTMEQIYREGYFDATTYHIDSEYGYINYPTESYRSNQDTIRYTIRYLKDTQQQNLDKSNITYHKTKDVLWQVQDTTDPLKSYAHNPSIKKKWSIYQLSDRKSCYYYILQDADGNMAIARYDSMENMTGSANGKKISSTIFDIAAVKSVRSITLERFQARSEDNPDRILSVYTSEDEKKEILERIMQAKIKQSTTKEVMDIVGGADSDVVDAWSEITENTPDNCYYLTIENKMEEQWGLGIVNREDDFIILTDLKAKDNTKTVCLSDTDKQWFQDVIEKADKVY